MTQFPQCHYLNRRLERCTAESVNPNPDVGPMLCQRHIAEVMQFVQTSIELAKSTQEGAQE